MSLGRARTIFALTLLSFALLIGRFAYIQIIRHDFYANMGDRQYHTKVTHEAQRGSIVDVRGRVLAQSVGVPSLYAIPRQIENPSKAAKALAPLLNVSEKTILRRLSSKKGFVYLKRHIGVSALQKVELLDLKGVHLKREAKRFYPNHYLASHVVGLAGIDNKGLAGLESKYNSILRGTEGYSIVSRDARSRKISFDDSPVIEAQTGQSIALTIDLAIQQIVQEQLDKIGEKFTPQSISSIVMEVDTGRVLALANWPTYDPNKPGEMPIKNRRNIAITNVFEPGSTFKSFVAALVLEKGLAKREDMFNCENGAWKIKKRVLHDHHPYASLSLEDVIVKSSNIGSAKMGFKIGKKDLYTWIKDLGFGERTGIRLPGESKGIVRPLSKWSYFSMSSIPMGHEIGLTPIQLASAYAGMVNGGVQVKPLLVEKYLDDEGRVVKQFYPRKGKRLISEETSAELRTILQQVVERGTARKAQLEDYTVGGKTGTSQKIENGVYSHSKYYASFAGFAPVEKAKIVVLIGVDEPKGSHYGGTVAAPYVGAILRDTLYYLRTPKSKKEVLQ